MKFYLVLLIYLLVSCQKTSISEKKELVESSGVLSGNGGNCVDFSVNGIYVKDSTTKSSNTVMVSLTVTSPGIINIQTDTVNGLYFRGSDTLLTIGSTTVKLFGHGKPVSAGTHIYNLKYDNSTCSFPIIVTTNQEPEDSITVYFGSMDGYFYAVQGISGKLKWRYPTGMILSAASMLDSSVFIGSADHGLYSLNARTGALNFKYYTGSWPYGEPIKNESMTANGNVYFSCANGKVYAINPTLRFINGIGYPSVKWIFNAIDGGYGGPTAPTIQDSIAFFGAGSNFYALDANTGVLKWKHYEEGPGFSWSNPAVANGIVYFTNSNNKIYAADAQTGNIIWSRTVTDYDRIFRTSPVIKDNILYTSTDTVNRSIKNILAINALTGDILMSYNNSGRGGFGTNSVALANNMLYASGSDSSLYAWDISKKDYKWRFKVGANIYGSPVVAGKIAYIASEDKSMYAIDATNGTLLWKYTTGDKIYASPFVASSNGAHYYPAVSGNQN